MSSQRYQEFIAERTRLLERIRELETENAELRKRLGEPVTPMPPASSAMQNLSLQEKIDLFCSLFKGRDDVFARRWYSKTSGKAGYQPVCQNEWTPLCDKRKYKCADCPNAKLLFILNSELKESINESVHTICKHYNVPCLDLKDIDKQQGHPSIKGMKEIAKQVTDYLKRK